jgi:hypothetical protein
MVGAIRIWDNKSLSTVMKPARPDHPILRMVSASEGVIGAAWSAIFILLLSRGLIR